MASIVRQTSKVNVMGIPGKPGRVRKVSERDVIVGVRMELVTS
ncbi:MAG TPA: hypothetical protein VFE84_09940 [Patescibacteria group bacterium]|nr:hypothetical protein [Patescibacteria group bacterium]